MQRPFLLISFSFLTLTCFCQRLIVDVNKENVNPATLVFAVGGQPFSNAKYVRVVEGSPYYSADWMRGSLMLKDSSEYINILLRLNILENSVEYIDKNGAEMLATTPIKELKLVDSSTGKSVRFIHSSAIKASNVETGWYQLLLSGNTTLYKKYHKETQESKPFGSATTEQRITTLGQYYILSNGSFTRIKKIKDIPELLSDKKKELQDRLTSKKLSGKTDQDHIDLVSYYNQLLQL